MQFFSQIQPFLSSLHLPFGINFIDLAIIIIFLFYALEGYSVGFMNAIVDLASFILSFVAALKLYGIVGALLARYFALSSGFGNAVGFFITAFTVEVVSSLLFRMGADYIPGKESRSAVNKWFGILPGAVTAGVLLSFLLSLVVALPLAPYLKEAVLASKTGGYLVANTQGIERKLNEVFGGAVHETINFLTIKPQSDEIVRLNFTIANGKTDQISEADMLEIVNKERLLQKLPALSFDNKLRDLARAHALDMLSRGYFSHYTLSSSTPLDSTSVSQTRGYEAKPVAGLSPFDRMVKADISFHLAGENLALAPSTDLAMQGLMQSPGHRANILGSGFGRIGIGVIDAGGYGKMFVQEFTD